MTKAGSAQSARIVIAGSSNTDLVCATDRLPRPGETVGSTSFEVFAGGKAANQAVAAARAGASVCFVGAFGDDEYGTARRAELESEGIDLEHCRTIPGVPSGLALIAVDNAGQNLIITVAGANDHIGVDELVTALDAFLPNVILFPNEAPTAVIERLARHSSTATTILNSAPYEDDLRELVGSIDILICNEIEASDFTGCDVSLANGEKAACELARLARLASIITFGDNGAISCLDNSATHVEALDVPVVDTTGAGDAFCGVFAAWLAAGEAFDRAVRAGVVAGSLAVTLAGAQPSLPNRAAIESRLAATN